ncbi:hypothetical protein GCM10028784_24320 [Myceligenerans cantabricum]
MSSNDPNLPSPPAGGEVPGPYGSGPLPGGPASGAGQPAPGPYAGRPAPGSYPGVPVPGQVPVPAVYVQALPKNDLGTWSLVTGILSWIVCPVILGVVAVWTGYASRRAVLEGQANNPGSATAGLILGWINIGLGLLALIFLVVLPVIFGLGALGLGAAGTLGDPAVWETADTNY